jgi:hypothetical protein
MAKDTPTYKLTDRLTRQEAAKVVGVSVSMLAHYRREGQISYEKNPITGAVRFVYADLLALKTKREASGTPTTGKQEIRPRRTDHRPLAARSGR